MCLMLKQDKPMPSLFYHPLTRKIHAVCSIMEGAKVVDMSRFSMQYRRNWSARAGVQSGIFVGGRGDMPAVPVIFTHLVYEL
jgi:hypothetical protein